MYPETLGNFKRRGTETLWVILKTLYNRLAKYQSVAAGIATI